MKFSKNICKVSATTMGRFLFACALVLCLATAANAQAGRGSISGTVTDPTGAIVPGAKVTLLNHATATLQHSVTSAAGLYTFVSLNPGAYQVTASMKGFESVAQDKINVTVDQTSTVNIALRVGAVTDTVTVSESVDLVETSNSTVGQLISSETIERVPLVTRDVLQLVQLSAGVTPVNGTPNGSDNMYSTRPGADVASYTINGALEGSVYYMLDGSPLGIAENNIAAMIPAFMIPEDGVDEYRVETQNAPATYASGGAGVISLVSKSGGNEFHGDGFIYVRPDIMAANDFFFKRGQLNSGEKNVEPSFHRYQEGGSFSGPILHKKLFVYGDYEATQQKQFDGGGVGMSVPTAAELQGDFTADAAAYSIYDPTTPDATTGSRQQFVGQNAGPGCQTAGTPNCISTARLNSTALAFMKNFPAPNVPSAFTDPVNNPQHLYDLNVPGLDPTTSQKFDIRMDWNKSEQQHIYGRFSFDRSFFSNVNTFGNMWDSTYFQNITNGRNILLADDYTLNPTTVLQLRYSFTRHYENQTGDPAQDGFDITTLGFPAALAAQENYKTLPYLTFADGFAAVGGTSNWNTFLYASENSDAIATLTKTLGKHEISLGAEYQKLFMNEGQPPAPSGAYAFDQTATDQTTSGGGGGSDIASALLGMGEAPGAENYNFTKDIFGAESSPYYAGFLQDTFHASKALTVTAGLRWDIFGGRTERHNRLEYFDPNVKYTFQGANEVGGEVFATSGNRTPFAINMTNFSPRLGISWQPVNHLVINAGSGIYYGPSTQMVANSTLDNDGYFTVSGWQSTTSQTYASTGVSDTQMLNPLNDPFAGATGIAQATGSTLGPQTNIGQVVNTALHSQRTLTTYNFNLGVEYEFPHAIVFSAGYVGSRGLFLPVHDVDLNVLDLATIKKYGSSLCIEGIPSDPASDPTCMASVQPNKWNNPNFGAQVPLWVSLQEFPQFGSPSGYGANNGVVVNGAPAGDSEYSSLQSKIQKRMTQHFTMLATFTWAKLITDDSQSPLAFLGSHAGLPQDQKNMSYEHAVSAQDVKYQFNAQASYDLPMGKGRAINLNGVANAALGGWTANAIAYISTGVPINSPTVGAGQSYFNQRPNMTCDPGKNLSHKNYGLDSFNHWFSADCFTQPDDPNAPDSFTPGTAPVYLDHVRTMGARDLDLSIEKSFKFGKERDLHFEVSSFNITNTPQFAAPAVPSAYSSFSPAAPGSPRVAGYAGIGVITSDVNLPRQFQFSSRFTF